MARREQEVTILEEGRDKDKVFVIKEMSATEAEDWAARAFLALAHSGIDIGETDPATGMAGIAVLGFKALSGVEYNELKYLMAEMFKCVKIKPNPLSPLVRSLQEEDIEEVSTRFNLRMEVFALHTGFSFSAIRSKLKTAELAE